MQFSVATLSLSLFAAVCAITLTKPSKNQVITLDDTFTVGWTSVSTDYKNFTLSARRQGDSSENAVFRITSEIIETADKEVTLDAKVFKTTGAYAIYAKVSPNGDSEQSNHILAVSQTFKVIAGNGTSHFSQNGTTGRNSSVNSAGKAPGSSPEGSGSPRNTVHYEMLVVSSLVGVVGLCMFL